MSDWNAGLLPGGAIWLTLNETQYAAIEGRALWNSLTPEEQRGICHVVMEADSHDSPDGSADVVPGPGLLTDLRHRLVAARRALAKSQRDREVLVSAIKEALADDTRDGKGGASAKKLTTAQVAKHLGIDKSTLVRLVNDAEAAGVQDVPWSDKGRGKRRWLRWDPNLIDNFFANKETKKWRGSRSAAQNTKSGGATSQERSARALARRARTQKTSSSKSKEPSPKGATGSLRSLAVNLSSEK